MIDVYLNSLKISENRGGEILTSWTLRGRAGIPYSRPFQTMKPKHYFLPLFFTACFASTGLQKASAFDVTNAVTSAQTASSGNHTVSATGSIILNSSSGRAVTLTGTGTTLTNSGNISQTNDDSDNGSRAIRATGTNIVITNNAGAFIRSADSDAIQSNNASTSITLNNSGTIRSNADGNTTSGQAIDWADITTGSNTINNFSTGILESTGSDAVRPGVNGIIVNAGIIRANPLIESGTAGGSDGIDAQTASGVTVTNTGTIQGRHGITGGATTFAISITNNVGGTIRGVNGSGINIDEVTTTSGATLINRGTITGNWDGVSVNGDGDGVDVDGVLNLTNYGVIRGLGANGVGSDGGNNTADGVAFGGGIIINETGAEITSQALTGNATTSRAVMVDDSSGGNAIAATSITNRGTIRSYDGVAISIVGNFADTITNDTGGVIRGTAATGAVVQTGGGADVFTQRGALVADSGNALDMGDGNDVLNIQGGVASITGNISGGAGVNTLNVSTGSGNTFSYTGVISNFSEMNISEGRVVLTGSNENTGTTTVAEDGILVVNNTSGSGTGSSEVTVEAGGTLAGTGSIGGDATVQSGGFLSAGDNSIGTLTFGGTILLETGSVTTMEINSLTDLADQLVLDGGGTLAGIFKISNLDGTLAAGDSFDLWDGANVDASGVTFDFSGAELATGLSWDTSAFGASGVVSVIPETGSTLLLGIGSLISLRRKRRAD